MEEMELFGLSRSDIQAVFMLVGNYKFVLFQLSFVFKSRAKINLKCLQNSAGKSSGPGALLLGKIKGSKKF